MFVCESLKSAARRESRNGGLLGCLIACCITCILSYIEFLTRFALTFSALTGEPFCAAGRSFLDTCTRHGFLKVVVIDYLASLTLNFGAMVFGLAVTAITVGAVAKSDAVHSADKTTVLWTVGVCAWLIASVVLMFIAGLLLNIVDAAYSCLVLDIDHRTRSGAFHRPEIAHAVLLKVQPTHAFVVQQPGGGVAYVQGQPVGGQYAAP
jgi:hypothetical protein